MTRIYVAPIEQESVTSSVCSDDIKRVFINAIIENKEHRVRELISDDTKYKLGLTLSPVFDHELDTLAHVKRKCPGTGRAYLPDDAWCLAVVYNARNVLQVLREFNFPVTHVNAYRNTFLHCLIAQASIEDEEQEERFLSTIKFMKSLISSEEYNKLLLLENRDGLRPLELASHLGTFALFQFLFDTDCIYKIRTRSCSMFSVQYFDITEYVTGKRYLKSPVMSMMLLDRRKINHTSLEAAFRSDPIKTWLTAVKYSNIPYVVIMALFRFMYIASFFLSLFETKRTVIRSRANTNRQMPFVNGSATYSDNYSIHDTDNTLLMVVLGYNVIYSISVLFFDMIYSLVCLAKYRQLKWNTRIVKGKKDPVMYRWAYLIGDAFSLIGILIISVDILILQISQQHQHTFSSGYINVMALTAAFACVWDVLYYLQLIPGLNLYVIAVQRMLSDFFSFGIVFMLFFFSYVFGFYILDEDADSFLDSAYGTFQLMLNVVNYAEASGAIQILHVTFIFMIVYLLLNILIAIFASSFEYVYNERHIILAVQNLSVFLIVDSVTSTLLGRFHNYLRQKYFLFDNGRVYVTRIVKKPIHN